MNIKPSSGKMTKNYKNKCDKKYIKLKKLNKNFGHCTNTIIRDKNCETT